MEEIYGNTNRVRERYHWVAKRWQYFVVLGLAYLLIYYVSGSAMQAIYGIAIFMCM